MFGLLVLFALLIGLSAFFSIFEVAFFSLSRPRLKELEHHRRPEETAPLRELLGRPGEVITLVVLAVALVNINIGVVGSMLLDALLPERIPATLVLFLDAIMITFVLLVLGELAPKLYALGNAEAMAVALSPPMLLVARVLGPPARGINRMLKLDRLLGRHGHGGELVTVEELRTILEEGGNQGALDADERQLLRGALRIGELTAGEVMVPREDMVAVDVEADALEVIETVRLSWHSRIPVYQDTLDRVVGIVHAKDLLSYLERHADITPVRDLMREATYVTAARPIDDVLRLLQREYSQVAVVTDPKGRALGICTIEDVLEQLVGEMAPGYQGDTPAVVVEGDSTLLHALVHVRDVNRMLGLALPLEHGRTVGDLVRNLIPGPPEEGESVRVAGVELGMESVIGGQVRRVRVMKNP